MITRLQQTLKDPIKVSLVVTVLFFMGIIVSAYVIYILPNDMMASEAIDVHNMSLARGVMGKLYLVIGLTFAAGLAALNFSIRAKKEIIVYREKEREGIKSTQQANGQGELESIDVVSFRQVLEQVKDGTDSLQEGLNHICRQTEAGQGALYAARHEDGKRVLEMSNGFSLSLGESQILKFEFGEGLVGQAAASGKSLYIDEVPQGYINILSGLGSASPNFLFIAALKKDSEVKGILEIASFAPLSEQKRRQIEEMGQVLAEKI